MTNPLPKIRYVEASPVENEGRTMFLLNDPTGYATEGLTISPELLFLIQHCDGETTQEKAGENYNASFGDALGENEINEILEFLDAHHFLDTEDFAFYKKSVDEEFIQAELRPMVCFPEDESPAPLIGLLDESFTQSGFLPGSQIKPEPGPMRGLIAPHIDLNRGHNVYAAAYGAFFSRFTGDTIIIFGTNHQAARSPVILTDKDFATPFGTVKTDKELVALIAKGIQGDPFAEQIAHRNEHSIELCATMLAYAKRHKTVRIVPILVSGMTELLLNGKTPQDSPMLSSAISAVRKVLGDLGDRAAVIASADLAHMGHQFGDDFEISPLHLSQIEAKDWKSLEYVGNGDALGFYNFIAKEQDSRRICGLAPIYMTVAALAPIKGELLAYDQWLHPDKSGTVSFSAMALDGKLSD
jgi:hypothetical protein